MKNFFRALILGILFLAVAGCPREKPASDAKADFIGIWKVTDGTGQVYYMTLNADGTGQTTREGGESGQWRLEDDYLEAEWMEKNLKLYFRSGQTQPLVGSSSEGGRPMGTATAVKVEKIPGETSPGLGR